MAMAPEKIAHIMIEKCYGTNHPTTRLMTTLLPRGSIVGPPVTPRLKLNESYRIIGHVTARI
jgi:hypothetical protein